MAIVEPYALAIYAFKSLQPPHAHSVGAADTYPSAELLCTRKIGHWISGRFFKNAERATSHNRPICDAVAPARYVASVVRMHAPADAAEKRGHARTRTISGISIVGSDHAKFLCSRLHFSSRCEAAWACTYFTMRSTSACIVTDCELMPLALSVRIMQTHCSITSLALWDIDAIELHDAGERGHPRTSRGRQQSVRSWCATVALCV